MRHSGEGEMMWQKGFQEKVGLGKVPEGKEWIQEQKVYSRWWGWNRQVGMTGHLG